MRLINVETYEIREFFGDKIPKYAILSHTWGEEEVTFQDMAGLHAAGRKAFEGPDELYFRISSKQGYEKIMYTCRQAREDRLRWAWVDTCCIDKTSSAELSEAINSMYQWYRESSECYAYLSDVPQPATSESGASESGSNAESLLKSSRWFTRGWTLQELIAPYQMKFFGQNWCALGSRSDRSSIIGNITRIPIDLMKGEYLSRLNDFSVAQKMSWAASRQCTRVEDSAYCLLGIFDINMPLLYGEGEKAFLRLQEEIFRETDDHSLLAWTIKLKSECWTLGSVFANSPLNFLDSGNIVRLHEEVGAPSLVTKKGLQISLHFEERSRNYPQYYHWQTFHAILNCGEKGTGKTSRILLLVVKDDGGDQGIKQSRCYSRLLTRQHLGVQDREQFQDPSGYETIFLRTHRHKFQTSHFRDRIQPPTTVQVHVHNISFDCMKARQDQANRVLGYTVKEVTYLTDGIAAYKDFDPDDIIARGSFFILRMKLHSNVGLPPLEARCGFQRQGKGRGHVRIWLESESEVRPSRTGQASQYVKIEGFSGDLMSASLRVEHFIFTIALRCKRSWDEGPGSHNVLESEKRVHFHIHISSRPVSSIQPYQDPTELSHRTWRTRDFFSLFERTEFFLAEAGKSIELELKRLKEEALILEKSLKLELKRLKEKTLERTLIFEKTKSLMSEPYSTQY